MTGEGKIRFLLVADSPGHTTGYYVVARALREAGIEVILGGFQQPSGIVEAAAQEDVDYVGYRIMDRERSEEHTSELQSHSFISYAVFCL